MGDDEGFEQVSGGTLDFEGVHASALGVHQLFERHHPAGVAQVGRDDHAAPFLVQGIRLDRQDVGMADDRDPLQRGREAAGVQPVLGELQRVDADEAVGAEPACHGLILEPSRAERYARQITCRSPPRLPSTLERNFSYPLRPIRPKVACFPSSTAGWSYASTLSSRPAYAVAICQRLMNCPTW